jgi:predicted amidohydrolase
MTKTELFLDEMVNLGLDAGQGNLLGVQPYMLTQDYATVDDLFSKLDGYLSTAAQSGWLNSRTIVVFPEYIGTWLAAAGEKKSILQAQSLNVAMRSLALSHPLALGQAFFSVHEKDRLTASLFHMQSITMAHHYQRVFSTLAQKYTVTVVAGSILLPAPHIHGGQVKPGSGWLENISVIYQSDGTLYPEITRKVYPIQDELPFVRPASVQDLPVHDAPAGRLGVLVCADSWYPQPYDRLHAQGVEILAVPSFITHHDVWDSPWGGYSGASAPADVDVTDVGKLTEGQAWRKYALTGRIARSGARAGVNVFLRGEIWDLGSDGYSVIANPTEAMETKSSRAALLNLWL